MTLFFILTGLLLIAYCIGSIPFGLLFTRWAGLGDIRQQGSGNIGATNVLRTGRRALGALTLLADIGKGIVVVLLGAALVPSTNFTIAFGLCAFLGHVFPIWLRFRGGKGVAVYLGVLLGIFWPLAGIFIFVWLMSALIWRYSSLAALLASLACLVALSLPMFPAQLVFLCLPCGALIVWTHRANIGRLRSGQETKIGHTS